MHRRDWMKRLGAALIAGMCGCGSKGDDREVEENGPSPSRFPPRVENRPKDRKTIASK